MRKSFLVGCIVVALGCGDAFLTGGGSTTSTTTTSTGGHGHGGKEDGGHGDGGSTTTSSSGGGGSTSTGGGGASSSGGGGSTSTGGGGASSSGGGGSGGSPDVYAIDWSTTAGHTPNTYLGIDLAIDQPSGPDTGMGDNKPYMGCLADSTSAETVHCELGPLEPGTSLTVTLYEYSDQAGSFSDWRCDQPGFPTSDCPGILEFSKNGDAPYATWQDDNVAATPPPPPCVYTTGADNHLQLICGIP